VQGQLKRENQRLQGHLQQTEPIIEVQMWNGLGDP
jgi:hypothetical protein